MQLPRNWRDLAMVMATATLVGTTISLAFPLLSLVLEREGASPSAIGLNAAAGGLSIFTIAPWIGGLIARIGAVRAMQLGLVLAIAALLALPLKVDLGLWFVLRFVLGIGSALLFVVSEAAINAMVEERMRGRVLGVYATMFCVGYAAGPAIVAVVGSEGVLPFAIGAALLALGLVPASLARGAARALAMPGHGDGARLALMWRLAPMALAAALVMSVLETGALALLPVYALAFGHGERMAALMLTAWIAGNVLVQIPIGWLCDRLRRDHVLAGCAAVSALAALAMPAAITRPFAIWPVVMVLGGSAGGLYTVALALLGQRFRGGDLPVANTAFVMTIHVGIVAGPPTAGLTMATIGPHGLPLTMALPCVVLLAAAVAAGRGTGRR